MSLYSADDDLPIYPTHSCNRGFLNANKYRRRYGCHEAAILALLALSKSEDREYAIAAALTLLMLDRIKNGSKRP